MTTTTTFADLVAEKQAEFFAVLDEVFAGPVKLAADNQFFNDDMETVATDFTITVNDEALYFKANLPFDFSAADDINNLKRELFYNLLAWAPSDAAAARIEALLAKHNVSDEEVYHADIYDQIIHVYDLNHLTDLGALLEKDAETNLDVKNEVAAEALCEVQND